jgi:hypothetical protein
MPFLAVFGFYAFWGQGVKAQKPYTLANNKNVLAKTKAIYFFKN